MTLDEPYFMQNKEWYYFDEEEYIYKLTTKATDEAIKSYKEFYDSLNNLRNESAFVAMETTEFINKYNLHDSTIEFISYNQELDVLVMDIDFCNWAQENYVDKEPENLPIKLVFKNVSEYKGLTGKIDSYGINSVHLNNEGVIEILIGDYFHGEYYELTFKSNFVEICV